MLKEIAIVCLMIALTTIALSIPLMDENIGEQIFHEYKIYLIYVHEESDLMVESMFNEYCSQDHLCAMLNPSVESYESFKSFVGETKKQYFLIVDASRRNKYVLPIISGMTAVDLHLFNTHFEQGSLQPFLASEDPDLKPYEPCRKLVGKDIKSFVESQTPVKVIFLYTTHEACDVCGEMLQIFAELAEKMYDAQIVAFGYYDIFRNDNPIIKDEILPYFLIFTEEKEEPFGLQGEKMNELYETIVEIVMKDTEIDVSKYRKEAMEKIESQKSSLLNQNEMKSPEGPMDEDISEL